MVNHCLLERFVAKNLLALIFSLQNFYFLELTSQFDIQKGLVLVHSNICYK